MHFHTGDPKIAQCHIRESVINNERKLNENLVNLQRWLLLTTNKQTYSFYKRQSLGVVCLNKILSNTQLSFSFGNPDLCC